MKQQKELGNRKEKIGKRKEEIGIAYFPITYFKNKIRVQGKARSGEKAEHTRSI